jgi:outer membrane protein assembly factor BamD
MSKISLERYLILAALCGALGAPAVSTFGQVATSQTGSSTPAAPPKKAGDQSTDAKPKPSSKLPGKGKAVPAPETTAEPDKVLFERGQTDIKKGRYTEGRLTYQTLINTYPDSEYLAKAKLGVADSYFKEGGTSNITQAIQEYKDFITFFPFLDESAYAQMQVAEAHYRMMEKADRDKTQAENAEDEFQTFLLKYPQSPLVPKAEQSLREVQEIIADSQFRVARFYYLKMNYAASAARLIDLSQRYPLYSESDEGLWMLADVYERAKQVSKNEDDKNHWADLATECYQRIIRDYPLSHWADGARSQLKAMNMPVPSPDPKAQEAMTKEQLYRKEHRQFAGLRLPMGMMKSSPDVSFAARVGQPNLNPPDDAISATDVLKPGATGPSFNLAMRPTATQEAPEAGAPTEAVPVSADSAGAPGNNLGVQIIDSGQGSSSSSSQPDAAATSQAAAADAADKASSAAPTITLQPTDAASSPATANSAVAPNSAAGVSPSAEAPAPTGGTIASDPAQTTQQTADKADSKTESTSKKKKGIHKIVPF